MANRQVWEEALVVISIPDVAGDMSSNQYKVVDAAGALAGNTGTGGLGILQNKPKAGETAAVAVGGVSKAIAGATIAVGDKLTNETTTGHVIPATSTNRVIGIALTAGNDTEIVSMLVVPSNAINAAS